MKQLSNEYVSITDQSIPGPEGAPEIRIRRYEPTVKMEFFQGYYGFTVVVMY
jgi:hypothetical protein